MADTQNTKVQEQDIHQLLKVKREKLANLQEAGKDPFQITKYDVTHHSTDIKNNFEELEGKTILTPTPRSRSVCWRAGRIR